VIQPYLPMVQGGESAVVAAGAGKLPVPAPEVMETITPPVLERTQAGVAAATEQRDAEATVDV